ncbi:MAG TPA: ABC transporter ATP-binding protein [Spirochaetia bacterium]|nr:MAG: ABC transporter ATP-binding protein [Spirochaetes bacterium GWB1_36_13]HCL56746.1 ABC transporter ATP-binding protein [Spirochaetia bacterium]
MLSVKNLSLAFGKSILFKEVNINFSPGNCYGLIGANGAGKSTFLKILSGDVEKTTGEISVGPNERMAVLRQDQFAYDEYSVLETVIMGHKKLYDIQKEKDEIYSKPDFSDEDGLRAAELEAVFGEMGGYESESKAAILLNGLGIKNNLHEKKMKELEGSEKVRVLLAQTLFDNPDILLLDEPTNQLDLASIMWLENFLLNFNNTVIVVSHDRHFLNKVCTHIADIDYQKISVYPGNYDFWYQASQLAVKQKREANRKSSEKIDELKTFIARFSANASKAKQATSRKKLLDKLTLEDIPASSRKYPYVHFTPFRECGDMILTIENLSKKIEGTEVIKNFNLSVYNGDKIAFVGSNSLAKTILFQMITGEIAPDSGTYKWGTTIRYSYFAKENQKHFDTDLSILDWLRQYSEEKDESFVRGFLGRMLFSGEDSLKKVNVLSGGEKVRCLLSKMMLEQGNALILDEPTNHLDLESITALNNGLIKYNEILLFSSHDHEFVQTVANRIIEITPGGIIDKRMSFDEYLEDEEIQKIRDELYHGHADLTL